jgi:flagellar motor switch protein FliN
MSSFLTQQEKTILQNLLDLWARANQDIMRTILNRRLAISKSILSEIPSNEDISPLGENNYLVFPFTISPVVIGNVFVVFAKKDLALFLDLIIGGDGSAPMTEFDKLHMSVLMESINQLAGSLESILSDNNLNGETMVKMGKPDESLKKLIQGQDMICASYKITIDGVSEIRMEILIPKNFSRELAKKINRTESQTQYASTPQPHGIVGVERSQGGNIMHRKANFPQLGNPELDEIKESKLDLLMDIPLEMTIVLGKTHINVKDLVEMAPGSIIELDQLAGEPVEILVNDRLVGYGEVIVVEENFGVRVIDVTDGRDQVNVGGKKQ